MSKFQVGHRKIGGRVKGTPNKKSQELIDLLREKNYNPVADLIYWAEVAKVEYKRAEEVLHAINGARSNMGMKLLGVSDAPDWAKIGVACSAHILPYVFPKKRPQEHKDPSPSEIEGMSTKEIIQYVKQTVSEFEN